MTLICNDVEATVTNKPKGDIDHQETQVWPKGKRNLKFVIPMVWRETKDHVTNCYFCMNDMRGFSKHKKNSWIYPSLESAIRPVLHYEEIPVTMFTTILLH